MMRGLLLNARRKRAERGQASLEFILVLIFMLVVVAGVTIPLGQSMQSALQDVSLVGNVSAAFTRIENDMNTLLGVRSDSVVVRDIFLPKGVSLACDPVANQISFTFSLDRDVFRLDGSPPSNCVDHVPPLAPGQSQMDCTRTLGVPVTANLTCQGDIFTPFTIATGAAGFSQRFRMGVKYDSSPFLLDFNAG